MILIFSGNSVKHEPNSNVYGGLWNFVNRVDTKESIERILQGWGPIEDDYIQLWDVESDWFYMISLEPSMTDDAREGDMEYFLIKRELRGDGSNDQILARDEKSHSDFHEIILQHMFRGQNDTN